MKIHSRPFWFIPILFGLVIAGCGEPPSSTQQGKHLALNAVPLVSNVKDYATKSGAKTDEKLVDAWGLEFGHTGRIWVNNNGTGFSTVYDGEGNPVKVDDGHGNTVPLAVTVPTPQGTNGPAALTGMVFSEKNAFKGDSFVFATEQGTIAGWDKPMNLNAVMRVDNSGKGAVYKGLTAADTAQGPRLYAANFATGTIDVFDTQYQPVSLAGTFADPSLPSGYAPFGIKSLKGNIYITYAKQSIDNSNDVAGVGNGYIDVFRPDGQFVKRLVSNGPLNSPWGLALAPKDFGVFSNQLLVGNFGDGSIHVFDPENGKVIGQVQIKDKSGASVQIDKLWALTFGNDNGAGKHNQLFYTAGPSAEKAGIFGRLDLVS
jgi:uncharacterized protein (TIGR03118 family)